MAAYRHGYRCYVRKKQQQLPLWLSVTVLWAAVILISAGLWLRW